MKEFLSMLKQDLVLSYRNGFFLIILGLAVFFGVMVNFVVPESTESLPGMYVVDETASAPLERLLSNTSPELLLDSRDELFARLEDEPQAVGVVIADSEDGPAATVYHPGEEPGKTARASAAGLASLWQLATGTAVTPAYSVETMREEVEKPPYNKSLVPAILVMEAVFIGFFFVAVMVFQDKWQGTIKALRVSPLGSARYVMSKAASHLAMALLYAAFIVLATVGLQGDLLKLLVLLGLGSLLMTMVGLVLGVVYEGVSDFIYGALVVMILAMLPLISYLMPSFKLAVFDYIPSYPLLFGAREALFPSGRPDFFGVYVLPLLIETAVMTVIATWTVGKRLLREV